MGSIPVAPARFMKRRRIGSKILACLVGAIMIVIGGIFIAAGILRGLPAEKIMSFCATEDNLAPELFLKGGAEMTILVGEEYKELGAEAVDDCSEVQVVVSGEVRTGEVGDYILEYKAVDEAGNEMKLPRRVRVRENLSGTIYLTFDDGPGVYTAELLDILAHYNVKATFFVTGAGPDEILLREFQEGHAIGVHTASHRYDYIYRNTGNFWADFNEILGRIERVTGESTRLARFPGGSSNTVSRNYDGGTKIMSVLAGEMTERGFSYFDWNVDSKDAGTARTAEEVFRNVVEKLKVGGDSVVLQHDIKKYSVEAVPMIIEYGLSNGFRFEKLTTDSYSARHRINN